MNDVLTVPEVAKRLRVAPSTVYAAIRDGQFPLPVIRLGGHKSIRISAHALDALLASATPSSAQTPPAVGRVEEGIGGTTSVRGSAAVGPSNFQKNSA